MAIQIKYRLFTLHGLTWPLVASTAVLALFPLAGKFHQTGSTPVSPQVQVAQQRQAASRTPTVDATRTVGPVTVGNGSGTSAVPQASMTVAELRQEALAMKYPYRPIIRH
jgi:hypothetical protein